MANEIEIVVKSTDRTGAGFDQAEKKAKGLHGTLKMVGASAAGFLAGGVLAGAASRLTGFIGDSVNAAKDLGESVNAVDKVFGNSAKEIQDWGKNNANQIGLSQRAFNQLATPLGAMLKNAGLGMKDVTGWTETLTGRAADLASVFNVDVGEAMEAIQAGLRGEQDPLEKFGVSLSAAKVQARALADTGKTNASALTDQEKATARLNLIMDQTKSTAGDFADTSGGLANAQRIAAAETEEMQAKIGQKLIPVALAWTKVKLKLVEVLSEKLIPAMEAIGTFVGEHATLFKILAVVIGGALVAAFTAWAISAGAAAVATIAATWPILAIGAAIALLVAGVIYAYRHWETFRVIVRAAAHGAAVAFHAVLSAVSAVVGWIRGHWPLLFAILTGPVGLAVRFVITHLGRIRETASHVVSGVRSAFSSVFRAIIGPIDRAVVWARNKLGQLLAYVRGIPGQVMGVFSGIDFTPWNAHGGIIGGAATGGARGGLTMVGEHGREMVRLPFGSTVMSNPDTERAMGGAGGPRVVTLRPDGSALSRWMFDELRRAIRGQGGNVQFVLGSA